jgi:hypothetical protein
MAWLSSFLSWTGSDLGEMRGDQSGRQVWNQDTDADGAEIRHALQEVLLDHAVIDPAVQHLVEAIASALPARRPHLATHGDFLMATDRMSWRLTSAVPGMYLAPTCDEHRPATGQDDLGWAWRGSGSHQARS